MSDLRVGIVKVKQRDSRAVLRVNCGEFEAAGCGWRDTVKAAVLMDYGPGSYEGRLVGRPDEAVWEFEVA